MKLSKLLILIFPIMIILSIITPNVRGKSAKLAYIYMDDPITATSYHSFLYNEGFTIDRIHVDFITTGIFDSHDIIIIGPDWVPFYRDYYAKMVIIDSSGADIIGLGNGGYTFFGLDGLGLKIGFDEGSSTYDITHIDVVDDAHQIFNIPNNIASGTVHLYSPGSIVYYIPFSTVPSDVDVYGKVASSSYNYCLCAEDRRYFLWGFEDSPDSMTQNGKDLFINLLNYYAPEESKGIPGFNILIIIGIFSLLSLIILREKFHKKI